MHGTWHSRLKPVTPLRVSNRPKQAHLRPQRRHRFHKRANLTVTSNYARDKTVFLSQVLVAIRAKVGR